MIVKSKVGESLLKGRELQVFVSAAGDRRRLATELRRSKSSAQGYSQERLAES